MKNMVWCRCPRCRHKMFMYDADNVIGAEINIKCSSCKRIIDVSMDSNRVISQEVLADE